MWFEVEFEVADVLLDKEKGLHCLDCLFRRKEDAACLVQLDEKFEPKTFIRWERQLKGCPVMRKEKEGTHNEKNIKKI